MAVKDRPPETPSKHTTSMRNMPQTILHKWNISESNVIDDQLLIDYLSSYLIVSFAVISNVDKFRGEVTFLNSGDQVVPLKSWDVYFCHLLSVRQSNDGDQMALTNVEGCINKLEPSNHFPEHLKPNQNVTVGLIGYQFLVSRLFVMPNWYVTSQQAQPRVLKCTTGESLNFVKPLTSPLQWKRGPDDKRHPFTPEERYTKNILLNREKIHYSIIPTPSSMEINDVVYLPDIDSTWVVLESNICKNEIAFLVGMYLLVLTQCYHII